MDINGPSSLYIKVRKVDSHIDRVTKSLEHLIFTGLHEKDKKRKRVRIATSIVSLVLLAILGAQISPHTAAESTTFYPESCLGGWLNPKKAEGKPEVIDGFFSEKDSAVLKKDTFADIYCGSFSGNAPEGVVPKKIILTLSWGTKLKQETASSSDISGESFVSSAQEILDATSTPDFILATSTEEVMVEGGDTAKDNEIKTENKGEVLENSVSENKGDKIEEKSILDKIVEEIISIFLLKTETAYAQEVASTPDTTEAIPSVVSNNEQTENVTSENISNVSQENTENKADVDVPTLDASADSGVSENLSVSVSTDSAEKDTSLLEDISKVLSKMGEIISGDTASTTESNEIGHIAVSEYVSSSTDVISTPSENESHFAEILYTLNGSDWISLGKVDASFVELAHFEIPVSSTSTWQDLSSIQIQIKRLQTVDEVKNVYLDGMSLEVSYEMVLKTSHPDFYSDTILLEKNSEYIRSVGIINRENSKYEVWYTVSTTSLADIGLNKGTWLKVEDVENVEHQKLIEVDDTFVFWHDNKKRVWSLDIKTGSQNMNYDDGGKWQIHFTDKEGKEKKFESISVDDGEKIIGNTKLEKEEDKESDTEKGVKIKEENQEKSVSTTTEEN